MEEGPKRSVMYAESEQIQRKWYAWNSMSDMQFWKLVGGGSYFWKGGSQKGGSDEPPNPPGYGPACLRQQTPPSIFGTLTHADQR